MTILIADDNALVRNWLKIMLQQAEGTQITLLEAADGDAAYDICMREAVDLLITDIRMPGRDGIELLKALRTERPQIRSAVLTSYDDFAYVRVALKCGALDYILKAEMQQEDISSLMSKVRESMAMSTARRPKDSAIRHAIRYARQIYAEGLRGDASTSATLFQACGLDPAASSVCCMLLNVEETASGMEYAAEVCCNALRMEKLPGLFFPVGGKSLLALYALSGSLSLPEGETQFRLLSSIDQNLTLAQAGQLRQNVTLTLRDAAALPSTLQRAKALVDYQCYYRTAELPPEQLSAYSPLEGEFLHILNSHLTRKNRKEASDWLRKYISKCHETLEFPYRIRRSAVAGTQMMLNSLSIQDGQTELYHQMDQITQELNEADTALRLDQLISRFCVVFTAYHDAGGEQISPAVQQAMDYCRTHYSEKLTLNQLSRLTGLNRTYFSQLFHKEAGIPFGDYLETIRIQNARRLLRDMDLSMSDIAVSVGFSNQNYFTKVFKKQTGLVPSQYRRQLFQPGADRETSGDI